MSQYLTRKTRLVIALATALCGFAGISQAQDASAQASPPNPSAAKSWQTGLHRTDLVKRDLDFADREAIQVRVDFEPGVAAPRHSHPGVEIAYVISGTFVYELQGQPAVTLHAGDSLYIPAGVPHVATNVGTTTGSELATYIVKKDVPLLKLEP